MAGPQYTGVTQVAKAIRGELKHQCENGSLRLPDGAKISVRIERASLMTAVNVTIRNVPAGWVVQDGRITAAAKSVGTVVTEVMRRHTNGYCWGDVAAAGVCIGDGLTPNSWRPGQD